MTSEIQPGSKTQPPGAQNPLLPLRVALIRQRYTPFGGAERFVERAMAALGRQGMAVTVVARQWRGEEGGGPGCDPFYLGRLWRDHGFARCVTRQWLRRPGWVVQSHERIPGCHLYRAGDGVHAQWLHNRGRSQNRLARMTTRLNPYHRYLLAMERRLFCHPDLRAVICNSAMVRDEIISWFGVAEEKLHIIHSGVDTHLFHPRSDAAVGNRTRRAWGIPEEVTLFLFVGSGFERKGLKPLLKALTQVPGAWLLVVGRDAQEAGFRKLAVRVGVSDRVRFAGGQKDVLPYYAAADAVVLPTLYDPFPNVALEAMACGLPLVTSYQCGARDFLDEGKGGVLCDALDVPALAGHLHDLMDARRRHDLGMTGRAVAESLSWERMTASLESLYRKIF
ncbi:MAG: glycosyltransferase family 4 protein [Magnetococcales bacterium]|nr:glycosyltransferase family 4 protein [Magnetococcales bacterium]